LGFQIEGILYCESLARHLNVRWVGFALPSAKHLDVEVRDVGLPSVLCESCGYCISCCPDSNIVELCTKVLLCKSFAVFKHKQWARLIASHC